MSRYLTKADFLAGIILKPVDFEVEGLGTVQVRGLGVVELAEVRNAAGQDDLLYALHGAHKGMTNPQMAIEDLDALGKGNPQVVSDIAKRIFELSGRGEQREQGPLPGNGS